MNTSSFNKKAFSKRKTADRPRGVGPEHGHSSATLLRSSLWGTVCVFGVGLLFLFIATVAAYATPDPNAIAGTLSKIALIATAFLAGFCLERIHGRSVLLCGFIGGGIFLLICTIAGLFIPSPETGISLSMALLYRISIFPISLLGSFLGRKHTKIKKNHKRF